MKTLDVYMTEIEKARQMLESMSDMFESTLDMFASADIPKEDEVNWSQVGSLRKFNQLLEYTVTQLPDQIADSTGEMVPVVYACPHCGERRIDMLNIVGEGDDTEVDEIHCESCHQNYQLP